LRARQISLDLSHGLQLKLAKYFGIELAITTGVPGETSQATLRIILLLTPGLLRQTVILLS
jgi:hypothetical protein